MNAPDPVLQKFAHYIYKCRMDGDLITDVDFEGAIKDKGDAYAVQNLLVDRIKAEGSIQHIGWKVGCTSKMAQKMSGTDEPFFGRIYKETSFKGSQQMQRKNFCSPIVEPEIAFRIGMDLLPDNIPFSDSDILNSVDCIMPAIEIVDCRFERGWPLSIFSTIADNGVHGAFISGGEIKDWKKLDRSKILVRLEADGEFVTDGVSSNALEDPLQSVLWLANNVVNYGEYIKKGDIISTGNIANKAIYGFSAQHFMVDFADLGCLNLTFS